MGVIHLYFLFNQVYIYACPYIFSSVSEFIKLGFIAVGQHLLTISVLQPSVAVSLNTAFPDHLNSRFWLQ